MFFFHFSFSRSFDGKLIPSVYMPPLYIYYIFFIDSTNNYRKKINLTKAVLFSQIIVSALSVYFFYKTNLIIFNKKISLISSYIFSLFPIHIFFQAYKFLQLLFKYF